MDERLSRIREIIDNLAEENESLKSKNKELNTSIDKAINCISELNGEIHALKSEIDEMKQKWWNVFWKSLIKAKLDYYGVPAEQITDEIVSGIVRDMEYEDALINEELVASYVVRSMNDNELDYDHDMV